jgi:phosphatidylserine decarboxylase precursor
MGDYEAQDFQSFNEFFIRKFKTGNRPFNSSNDVFCAGAEARYLAFENITANSRVKVKGIDISISELFGHTKEAHALAQEFDGGTVIIARLCPVDYHRFHFPCSGTVTHQYRVEGLLHSVNPAALSVEPAVFLQNERQVCIMKNDTFGNVAMIEVGALGVEVLGDLLPQHRARRHRRAGPVPLQPAGVLAGARGGLAPSAARLGLGARRGGNAAMSVRGNARTSVRRKRG